MFWTAAEWDSSASSRACFQLWKMISHTIKLRQAPLGAEDPEAGAFAFRSAYAARSFALGHADALSRLG